MSAHPDRSGALDMTIAFFSFRFLEHPPFYVPPAPWLQLSASLPVSSLSFSPLHVSKPQGSDIGLLLFFIPVPMGPSCRLMGLYPICAINS